MVKCTLHTTESPCGGCCTHIHHLGVEKGGETLLSDVNFELHCGELTVLIGRNGAGKTTLIKALLGQEKYSGAVEFFDRNGVEHPLRIGYVPQRLAIDENSPVSVYDFCAAAVSKRPVFLPYSKKLYRELRVHLGEFGAEALIDRKLAHLSGGELQRVLLAAATLNSPELLILDEPAAGVDAAGMADFYEKLNELKREQDLSILLVSHDFGYLRGCADRLILLNKRILCVGSCDEVFASREFAAAFGTEGGTEA